MVIGNTNIESVKDIWFGKKMRQLQLAMLMGKRNRINFCNACSAPKVCMDEDLDPHKKLVLTKMYASEEEMKEPNPWLDLNLR